MATTYWPNGSGTNVWGTAGNWSGGVPTNSDDAVIDGSRSSNASINGATVVTPANTYVRNYKGSVGTAASPIVFSVSNGTELRIETLAAGSAYFDSGAVSVATTVVKSQNRSPNSCILTGNLASTLAVIISGYVNGNGLQITQLEVGSVGNASRDAIVSIDASSTFTWGIIQSAGQVDVSSVSLSNLMISGGICTAEDCSITSFDCSGGRAVLKGSGWSGIGEVNNTGVVDLTQSTKAATYSSTYIRNSALVDVNNGVPGTYTFTNAPIRIGPNAGFNDPDGSYSTTWYR